MEVVVTTKRDERTKANTEGVEDLGGGANPNLKSNDAVISRIGHSCNGLIVLKWFSYDGGGRGFHFRLLNETPQGNISSGHYTLRKL